MLLAAAALCYSQLCWAAGASWTWEAWTWGTGRQAAPNGQGAIPPLAGAASALLAWRGAGGRGYEQGSTVSMSRR